MKGFIDEFVPTEGRDSTSQVRTILFFSVVALLVSGLPSRLIKYVYLLTKEYQDLVNNLLISTLM